MAKIRKIIHVDMDCFYAAVEMRDNPSLRNKPVAVGGSPNKRGVISTCNYLARQYGVHSAMPTSVAYQYCRDLVLLPGNMEKYHKIAENIHHVFYQYTDLVEPLALDEAYLDVTDCKQHAGSATWIAQEIKAQIWEAEGLKASAGVAGNKLLAKIASGWKKPDGLFVILPEEADNFVQQLPVKELYGVGPATAKKLFDLNLRTCADLQKLSLADLYLHFGKMGEHLYYQARGMDDSVVEPNRIRKSLSVERTFSYDFQNVEACSQILPDLYAELCARILESSANRVIKNQFIKIKYSDFTVASAQISGTDLKLASYGDLLRKVYQQEKKAIRLLGLGVSFYEPEVKPSIQLSLF